MILDPDQCYRALRTHDARFDGRFFVGVAHHRHLLPPGVHGEDAARENCTFFPSAAAAEAAGYRPCLRCRPETRARHAAVDAQPAPRAGARRA